jgi:DNA repair exonuclease SbcCD ATPase subunit
MANKTPQKTNNPKNPPVESSNSTSKEPIANKTPPIVSNDDDISELFTIVGEYVSSGGLSRLKKLKNDNEELQKETISLRTTNKESLRAYNEDRDAWKAEKIGFTRQIQEKEETDKELRTERKNNRQLSDHAKGLEDHIIELVQKTKTDESEITRLTNINTKHGETINRERDERIELQEDLKAMEGQLGAKTRDLSSAEESLEVVRAFLVQLSPLDTKRAQMSVQTPNPPNKFRTITY